MLNTKYFGALYILLLLSAQLLFAQQTAHIVSDDSPQAKFAITKIARSLSQKKYKVTISYNKKTDTKAGINIILAIANDADWNKVFKGNVAANDALKPEGFRIQLLPQKDTVILVTGKDNAGRMYGGFELAEIISTEGPKGVKDVIQNPYMKKRGIKMNIPLDARTPSYTDASEAAQQNIPEMWDLDFWKEHIDSLASYRYNLVSLWNLHPFPSMIKVPEYPDVALQDVHRSTVKWNENYSTRGTGIDGSDIVDNYEVVKKISMDEKIKFWREVMRYGKERNVEFYIVTWNVFTNSTKGKYRITDDLNNPVTRDYFRKSVKQLLLTYPDLAGIGLTTGENMPGADFEAKENWSFDTYGQGVLDALKEQPNRKITFIHRQHEAGALEIVKKFAPLTENKNVNFIFSFKYAQAHVYSSTTQIFHPEFVKEIQSKNLKTLWTLRNDDVYYFRWGAPDFVREFIRNIPTEVSEGYYYGSDQYIWGREFLDLYPHGKRPVELAKHWYHWMIWGRLGYDPSLSNDRFVRVIQNHFPGTDAKKLFDAWQSASMIYPVVTGYHWGALDFQWYIEGSKSRPEPAQTPSGFHDVNRFISLPPHKGTDYLSIPDFVAAQNASVKNSTTPFQVAARLNEFANHALKLTAQLSTKGNTELYKTLQDIQAMAYLGKHFAGKIKGATEVALFRNNANNALRDSATQSLTTAALNWRYYASIASGVYKNPLWTNRVGYVDWKDLYNYALKDIRDNSQNFTIPDMILTTGGKIAEAEHAILNNARLEKTSDGSACIVATAPNNKITWTYNSDTANEVALEFIYIKKDQNPVQAPVAVNEKPVSKITFWQSGSGKNLVWDRCYVILDKGSQSISITLPENVMLKQLNILKL